MSKEIVPDEQKPYHLVPTFTNAKGKEVTDCLKCEEYCAVDTWYAFCELAHIEFSEICKDAHPRRSKRK